MYACALPLMFFIRKAKNEDTGGAH